MRFRELQALKLLDLRPFALHPPRSYPLLPSPSPVPSTLPSFLSLPCLLQPSRPHSLALSLSLALSFFLSFFLSLSLSLSLSLAHSFSLALYLYMCTFMYTYRYLGMFSAKSLYEDARPLNCPTSHCWQQFDLDFRSGVTAGLWSYSGVERLGTRGLYKSTTKVLVF